jgi:hypothetical protein
MVDRRDDAAVDQEAVAGVAGRRRRWICRDRRRSERREPDRGGDRGDGRNPTTTHVGAG